MGMLAMESLGMTVLQEGEVGVTFPKVLWELQSFLPFPAVQCNKPPPSPLQATKSSDAVVKVKYLEPYTVYWIPASPVNTQ